MRLRLPLVVAGLILSTYPEPLVDASPLPAPTRQNRQRPIPSPDAFTVNGDVALSSFISLTNAHLQKLSDSLQAVATTEAARSTQWERIRGLLRRVGRSNVPAVLWFSLPDGSYWTLENGKETENLASRPYFPRVLGGKVVLGDLVVSRSTGKSVAIVAVPVRRESSVVGVLGASVHLDRLSLIVRQEMALDNSVIFFTFDRSPLLGLVWDPGLIMVDPTRLGEPVARAFRQMLAREHGTVTYTFRNVRRTVLYRKSPVTNWWYAFGKLRRNGEAPR